MFGKGNLEYIIVQMGADFNEIQKKISNRTLSGTDIDAVTANVNAAAGLCNPANLADSKILEGLASNIKNYSKLADYLTSIGAYPTEVSSLNNAISRIKPSLNAGKVINVGGKAGAFLGKGIINRFKSNVEKANEQTKSIFGK